MVNTELYLNTSDGLLLANQWQITQITSFPGWNRIHLDVFEFEGTFQRAAAHPSLATL